MSKKEDFVCTEPAARLLMKSHADTIDEVDLLAVMEILTGKKMRYDHATQEFYYVVE